VAALAETLADPEEFVRWQAADALANQEPGQIFPVLADLLNSADPLQRAGAAAALGQLDTETAAQALTAHLGDPDPTVRRAVVDALGFAGGPEAVQSLIPVLHDRIIDVRWAAATALGRLGGPEAAVALAHALARKGQPLLVRRSSAAALARAPHSDAQPELVAALADPDPQVRAYAARALGAVGDEAARPALAALKADRARVLNGTVGDAAAQALTSMDRRARQTARDKK
jgi:HEAT repeat protein